MPSLSSDWYASKRFGKAPLVVEFTDISQAEDTEITSWDWDFGDGQSSTQQSPTHVYTVPGLYTVRLTVGDGSISDYYEEEDLIQVYSPESLPQLSIDVLPDSASVVDVNLYWKAYDLADENTDYRIRSDVDGPGNFDTVATVDATEREESSGDYHPYMGALVAAIGRDDIHIVYSGMGFELDNNQRIRIDGETIFTGGGNLSGEVWQDCKRGRDNTIRRPHAQYAAVAHMHESYEDEGVDFGARHVIRYEIITETSLGDTLAAEALAVKPSPPPTDDFCTIWGVLQDSMNQPLAGVPVRLVVVGNDVFNTRTGEVFSPDEVQNTLSDADGYWQVFAPKDVAISLLNAVKLVINEREFFLSEVPTLPAINYLECI